MKTLISALVTVVIVAAVSQPVPAASLGELIAMGKTIQVGDVIFSDFSTLPAFAPQINGAMVDGILVDGRPGLRFSGGELNLSNAVTNQFAFMRGAPEFTVARAAGPAFTGVELVHRAERTGAAQTTTLAAIRDITDGRLINDTTLATEFSPIFEVGQRSAGIQPPHSILRAQLIIEGRTGPFTDASGSISNVIDLTFSSDVSSPVPVPEPSSRALLIGGCILLGFMHRRKSEPAHERV